MEYIHDRYELSYKKLGLFTGPSHAEEVSRGKLSYLTVVCTDLENARLIGSRFAGQNISEDYTVSLRQRHEKKHLQFLCKCFIFSEF